MERVALGEIVLDEYTISSAIETVLKKLESSPRVALSGIIQEGPHALAWIAALFVGVLELTRLGEIAPDQDEAFGEIFLTRLGTPAA
jgi:chromatin segregation and condensation protein Rec8/ScpA/Scc1 (kleisin family)